MLKIFTTLFTLSTLSLAGISYAGTLDPVTLNTPSSGDITSSSVTLNWDQTTTANSDFHCYQVFRSTEPGLSENIVESLANFASSSTIPTLGTWGAIILVFLFIYSVYRKQKTAHIITVILFLTFGAYKVVNAVVENPWISSCLSSIETLTYTDSELDSDTTYYYRVYVISNDLTYVESNEVSVKTETSSASNLSAITDAFSKRETMNIGGGNSSSSNYALISNIGQSSAVGISSDGVYANHGGFWGIPYSPAPPKIYYFTPAAGSVGMQVRILGKNYSLVASNNTVKFNGTIATVSEVNSDGTQLTTKVPSGASTGNITVTVSGVTDTGSREFNVR